MSAPMFTWYKARKLRIMKPAPASSTSVSASSITIRAPVQRRARLPPVPDRPPASFSTSCTSVFETCSAGARPKTMPVPRQMAARNASTTPSIVNFIQYGLPTSAVSRASKRRTPRIESPRPRTPLTIASRTLSTSSWRTMRQRLAPSDTRTAISRVRCVERASSRFATFAHAISSTKATAPISERKMSRICPPVIRWL